MLKEKSGISRRWCRVMILESFAFGHMCLRLLGRVISESDMGWNLVKTFRKSEIAWAYVKEGGYPERGRERGVIQNSEGEGERGTEASRRVWMQWSFFFLLFSSLKSQTHSVAQCSFDLPVFLPCYLSVRLWIWNTALSISSRFWRLKAFGGGVGIWWRRSRGNTLAICKVILFNIV